MTGLVSLENVSSIHPDCNRRAGRAPHRGPRITRAAMPAGPVAGAHGGLVPHNLTRRRTVTTAGSLPRRRLTTRQRPASSSASTRGRWEAVVGVPRLGSLAGRHVPGVRVLL